MSGSSNDLDSLLDIIKSCPVSELDNVLFSLWFPYCFIGSDSFSELGSSHGDSFFILILLFNNATLHCYSPCGLYMITGDHPYLDLVGELLAIIADVEVAILYQMN